MLSVNAARAHSYEGFRRFARKIILVKTDDSRRVVIRDSIHRFTYFQRFLLQNIKVIIRLRLHPPVLIQARHRRGITFGIGQPGPDLKLIAYLIVATESSIRRL